MIELKNLSKAFGKDKQVIENLNCTIPDNAIYGLVGANGAGRQHHSGAGAGGNPSRYLSCHGDVCKQRNRVGSADCGDRQGLPRGGRDLPHRRGTGGRTSADQRGNAEH